MPISKDRIELKSLQDWERLAGPKSQDQWVDGRSAKEAARAWLQGNGVHLPPEVATALADHPAFGPVRNWDAEPEAKLRFDKFAGETRNSDLAVYAQDAHGPFLIAVEAKADEPFGETVAETLSAALERYLDNNRSNAIARVQQLAQALLGPRKQGDPTINEVRYQLLTACAGAVCEAERCGYSRALMLVHEFVTDKTKDANHCRNAADLDLFLRRLSHGAVVNLSVGEILGPFTVPGGPLLQGSVALFIGKVSRNLRTNSGDGRRS
jgi:hypothetical protein